MSSVIHTDRLVATHEATAVMTAVFVKAASTDNAAGVDNGGQHTRTHMLTTDPSGLNMLIWRTIGIRERLSKNASGISDQTAQWKASRRHSDQQRPLQPSVQL